MIRYIIESQCCSLQIIFHLKFYSVVIHYSVTSILNVIPPTLRQRSFHAIGMARTRFPSTTEVIFARKVVKEREKWNASIKTVHISTGYSYVIHVCPDHVCFCKRIDRNIEAPRPTGAKDTLRSERRYSIFYIRINVVKKKYHDILAVFMCTIVLILPRTYYLSRFT